MGCFSRRMCGLEGWGAILNGKIWEFKRRYPYLPSLGGDGRTHIQPVTERRDASQRPGRDPRLRAPPASLGTQRKLAPIAAKSLEMANLANCSLNPDWRKYPAAARR
jgi:hypothetical protein